MVAFVIGAGGVADLSGAAEVAEGFARLGYPEYFATILGVWKIGGAVVILLPKTPLLKEWAYAGIVFDLTGAAASHVYVSDPVGETVVPLVVLALTVASWMLRPAGRRLAGV
ncbi:MAG: DoxX family protein [Myxococcota bacterium]